MVLSLSLSQCEVWLVGQYQLKVGHLMVFAGYGMECSGFMRGKFNVNGVPDQSTFLASSSRELSPSLSEFLINLFKQSLLMAVLSSLIFYLITLS